MNPTNENRLIRIPQACQILGCQKSFLYELIGEGVLQKVKVGRGTRLVESEVNALRDAAIKSGVLTLTASKAA